MLNIKPKDENVASFSKILSGIANLMNIELEEKGIKNVQYVLSLENEGRGCVKNIFTVINKLNGMSFEFMHITYSININDGADTHYVAIATFDMVDEKELESKTGNKDELVDFVNKRIAHHNDKISEVVQAVIDF